MSQYDFSVLDPQVVTGTVLAEDLNSWRDAVHSSHLGVARPSYVRQGMLWLDSSSQNLLVLYLYDGVEDIAVGTFNTNNHTSSIGGGVQGADITTPDAVALWDSTTGKLLKNGVLITASVNDTTAGRLLQVGASKAQLGDDVVGTTGDQTVAGVKTFSSKLAIASSLSANASEGAAGQVLKSGGAGQPAVWGDSASVATRIWRDVMANRVTGTSYTNNTSEDMDVSVGVAGAAVATGISATVNGIKVGDITGVSTGSGRLSICFTVPAGGIYIVTRSGAGFNYWSELSV